MEGEHQDGEYSFLPNSHNGIDNGNNNEGPIHDDRSWEDIPGPSYLNHFNDDIPSSSSSSNYETPSKRAKTIESSESSTYDTSSSYESSSSNDQGPYWKRKLAPRRKRFTKTAKLRKSITRLREKTKSRCSRRDSRVFEFFMLFSFYLFYHKKLQNFKIQQPLHQN